MTEEQAAEIITRLGWINENIQFQLAAQYVLIGVVLGAFMVLILGVFMRDF